MTLFDPTFLALAGQMNAPAWQGIDEARKAGVATTTGNLQALVDKRTAQSEMIGSMTEGLSPIFGNLGTMAGSSLFPGGGTTASAWSPIGFTGQSSGRQTALGGGGAGQTNWTQPGSDPYGMSLGGM